MEFKDYYQILGVASAAQPDEIKKAYRKLARKYHPDVSKEPDAQDRMRQVNEAYAVLSDPKKRSAYDDLSRRRAAGMDFEPAQDWDGGFATDGAPSEDFSEFFANLFGRNSRASRGGGAPGASMPPVRGEDQHASIEIELRDAYQGGARSIGLRTARLDESGHVVADQRTLQVQIPKGVREGQQIRLAGQGGQGLRGGSAGDLYLEVRFSSDPRYRAEGRDVTEIVPVAPWEAMLGARIEVPTTSGRLEVSVPRGSNASSRDRVSNSSRAFSESGGNTSSSCK